MSCRPLGVDSEGQVYIPMAPDLAPVHHHVAGHPVTAGGDGAADLFIQVTQLSGGTFMADKKEIQPFRWHVSVNNSLGPRGDGHGEAEHCAPRPPDVSPATNASTGPVHGLGAVVVSLNGIADVLRHTFSGCTS